jgi:predicted MPP superfamily phosphohydrolase
MKRRKFIKNITLGSLAMGGVLGGYAWQVEPFWLEFVERTMSVKNLPKALEGKTLMQISDIHVGDRFDYSYLIESFKEAAVYQPDFVVYTGDFVNYNSVRQLEQLKEVAEYAVLGKIATLGVLGNHDYGENWSQHEVADAICSILQNAGITVLRNEQQEYEGLNFIGFDDYWGINFNPELAMRDFKNDRANIALCHNPDVCDLPVWKDYNSWILSGHTHGGQCKPPFLPAPMLPVKNKAYDQGEIDLNDGRKLYINRALGHLWQVRFNVRPEITVFELQRA